MFLLFLLVSTHNQKPYFGAKPIRWTGKVDTVSFWPIPWWKRGTPVTKNALVLIGEKTHENPQVFKGQDMVIKGEHRII